MWLGIFDEPYFHALNGLHEHVQFFIKKIFASFFSSSDANTGNNFSLKMSRTFFLAKDKQVW